MLAKWDRYSDATRAGKDAYRKMTDQHVKRNEFGRKKKKREEKTRDRNQKSVRELCAWG